MKNILEHFHNKKILVTGGAGCIGSNLVGSLMSANPKSMTVIDDLSSSYEWNLPRDPKLFFVKGSITNDEAIDSAFSNHPDYVFHLAAHFANQNSIDHPDTDLIVNGLGTLKVLKHAHLAGVQRLVFASSGCSVYGSEAPLPLTEDYVSLHLDTPYQITKLLGELYCNFFYDYYSVPTVNARFFNVYGPGEVPGRYRNVIPNFVFTALKGRPLPITGTGEETRDFTYVSDIVDGILRCATHEKAIGDSFNLASGIETTISHIGETVNKLTKNKAGIVKVPRRNWDKISRRRASIEKASRVLGYSPSVKIEDGLAQTVKWIESNMDRIERMGVVL